MTSEQKLADTLSCEIKLSRVSIGKHVINYAVAGSGPTLLLIHGGNIGWGSWYKNIPALAKHFTVYAIDLPGSGRSSGVDFRSLDVKKDFFDIGDGFISKMKFQTFSIMGSSVGGWIALQLALAYPDRVTKVIVSDPAGLTDYLSMSDKIIGWYPLAKAMSLTVLRPTFERAGKFLKAIFYNKKVAIDPAFEEYFYETMTRSHSLLFISRMNALHAQFSMGKDLRRITNSIAIVWGQHDTILPLEENRKSFSLFPHVQVTIMKDSGHMPFFEQAEEYNNHSIRFLQNKSDQ